MLKKEIKQILRKSKRWGWVLEPDAQKILSLCGFDTPKYSVAKNSSDALSAVQKIGYPVAAKIVSPAIVHKSDVHGVVVGIRDDQALLATLARFQKMEAFTGMLIAEMVKGLELIIGAKNDIQFGPMIMVGMGGVGVEIYKDVALRMAPLKNRDVDNMLNELAARKLLAGYRGKEAVSISALKKTIIGLSGLVMDMRDFVESVDLNPVMCGAKSCIIADARIMLRK
jgi:hypothetical protein